jgi:hypothetical protein
MTGARSAPVVAGQTAYKAPGLENPIHPIEPILSFSRIKFQINPRQPEGNILMLESNRIHSYNSSRIQAPVGNNRQCGV